jgi:hypothetical protein
MPLWPFKLRPPPSTAALTPDGVLILRGDQVVAAFNWSVVDEIVAWKEDLWGVDLICVGFRLSGRDSDSDWITVHEEMPGYKLLIAELERRFPEHRNDWWSKVVQPPFAECRTTIYQRSDSCP